MASARKTREQILAFNDIKEEEMSVPEWDATLKIRGFTLAQRHSIFDRATNSAGVVNGLRATLLTFIAGVVDPPFSEADETALRGKSAAVERVAMRILALSGVGKDALETAIKNSDPTMEDNSSIA